MTDTLLDILKAHEGRRLGKSTHLFEAYETHFAPYRGGDVRLLEIGIRDGGSLELWQSYFGRAATIVGIDIDPVAVGNAPDGTIAYEGSQDDEALLAEIADRHGPFDIILDDGSHEMDHQIGTMKFLYPRMADTGLYICEDTSTSYIDSYGGAPGEPGTYIEYTKGLIDQLHADFAFEHGYEPTAFTRTTRGIHFYSGSVVFERRPSPEPTLSVVGEKHRRLPFAKLRQPHIWKKLFG